MPRFQTLNHSFYCTRSLVDFHLTVDPDCADHHLKIDLQHAFVLASNKTTHNTGDLPALFVLSLNDITQQHSANQSSTYRTNTGTKVPGYQDCQKVDFTLYRATAKYMEIIITS